MQLQQFLKPASGSGSVLKIFSHCPTTSKRENYIQELRKYIQARLYVLQYNCFVIVNIYGINICLQVDLKGGCGDEPCDLLCYDANMENHKFYLSFENAICQDYITEKFFSPLERGLVPIVLGLTARWLLRFLIIIYSLNVNQNWGHL